MAAPYWGDLPGPQVAGRGKPRGASDDYSSHVARRQSLDATTAGPSQPKANRASVQTTNTEAPTESTLSPYASPTASSFQGQGLAPRPPSLTYGQSQHPPEVLEKRRRRASRNRDEDLEYAAGPALPAAPDVPKQPPVSYRHPFGNGGLPYTYTKPGGVPVPDYPVSPGSMDPEEYYKAVAPEAQDKPPILDRSQKTFNANSASKRRRGSVSEGNGGTRDAVNGHQGTVPLSIDPAYTARKASIRSPSDRRNITKEEKRARVEAAEQRARERANIEAPDKGAGQQPQVRFKERRPSMSQDGERPSVLPDPVRARTTATQRGPLSQNPPDDGQRHGPVSGRSPKVQAPEGRPRGAVDSLRSGIPQRNLSFRERAEKTDMRLPTESDSPTTPTATTPTAGVALTRSGSNKLKKEPPGDPWFSRRQEAEKKFPMVQTRHGSVDEPRNAGAPAGPTVPRAGGGSVRDKALPPPPPGETRMPSGSRSPPDHPDHADIPHSVKVTRGPSQRDAAPRTDQRDTRPHAGLAAAAVATGAVAAASGERGGDDYSDEDDRSSDSEHHHVSDYLPRRREKLKPGQGMYNPPKYLDEWKKGTVGTLSGALLDLEGSLEPGMNRDQTWWENAPSKRRGSMSSRPRKAEAFDGEYDETNAPTRFKPPLYLKCGPLLRFCGIQHERAPTRSTRNGAASGREIWRGTVMIVTQDRDSSYDIAPTLRLFVQPIELLPPPPTEVQDELPPEYVDPIAGHPKLGRKGETLYVRPVEQLEEARDLSRDETDDGLFEKTKTPPDVPPKDGSPDPPGSFAYRRKRVAVDGEKVGKYKDVRGYRLHVERGYTFWRFSIEVELRDKEQRIAYRINRGPATGFWVPARGQSMNVMFHSCNGFSLSVDPDQLSGPDPMWRDVLNTHQSRPFHVMLGGGDQLYCDSVMRQTKLFQNWLMIKNPLHKHNAPFTAEMQEELEEYYLERYAMWFSQGLFGLANSQIPMVNMYDDHDIIDGFGSYPQHFMHSPVFSGLGNVAFKYYMLFQHQSVVDETEATEPSWTLGERPGPYINEVSRSLFMFLGSRLALLAVDCRTERMRDEVVSEDTWRKIMDRCYAEIVKGKVDHLLVLLGVPIAYPRLVWLENILTSRLMDPIKALGRTGVFGNVMNKFDGGVEVLDDLDDHWTAKNHKAERAIVIEDLQDLAADKSLRITMLSGDVHLAAVGQFYSNPKLGLAKHKDFRYMPNVISSAIANTPPPDLMADILNKRNKVHHFDKNTDEDMIPLFTRGVEGKPRNNKRLLPHRNWCSIREYTPGANSPPPSPPPSAHEESPVVSPGGRMIRRLSKKSRGPTYRPDVLDSRPPLSSTGGLFRSFSRGRRASADSQQPQPQQQRPGMLTRTLSLTRGDFNIFRRAGSRKRNASHPDDGGINGTWGDSDEEEEQEQDDYTPPPSRGKDQQYRPHHGDTIGLRGGAGAPSPTFDEFSEGDDSYFTARAPRNNGNNKAAKVLGQEEPIHHPRGQQQQQQRSAPTGHPEEGRHGEASQESFRPGPFRRVPTGLSTKQKRHAAELEVDVEGGLDICLNVEVNPRDPAGITVPYRLLVPRLWYEYEGEEPGAEGQQGQQDAEKGAGGGGIKRFLSLKR
ncbi:Transcription factor [Pleurostoma richardsiae]|uniref:Transcription factor n=1 Tax=Pleurostoma richardsiae TaxID=41990 RepID=A0AA38VXX1_9PEZI|nr:Transcription factor [Pleurostoma richardsiae]